jgi:ribokinase
VFASIGDLLADVTVLPLAPVSPNDDTPATIRIGGGGQAANWCAWITSLGGRARLITKVGDDATGRRLVEELEAAGVEVCAARSVEPTGAVVAVIGADGDRSFYTQRGAVVGLSSGELQREWLDGVALLHLPLYSLFEESLSAAARQTAGWAREAGVRLAVDLSSAAGIRARGAGALRDELRALRPELLFATEAEADAIGGDLDELAELSVVKLGAGGCRIGRRVFPASPAEVVDSTGAGDAFAAGFCLAWLRTCDVERAAVAGLEAGALAVGRIGARP